MADNAATGGQDIKANQATYSGFLSLFKYGIVGVGLITALVVKLLA